MTRKHPQSRQRASERIEALKERIGALDLLCSGTLLERTMRCGKPACRCAKNPKHRHGPYWEWGRMQRGKLVHRLVSPEQARFLRAAIANYRAVRKLLRTWEAQTLKIMEAQKDRN